MNPVFDEFPLLLQAHRVIRTSRSARYFERADRISIAIMQPFRIRNGLELLTGTNMAALDQLFEDAPDVPRLNQIVTEMQALTDPDTAAQFAPTEMTVEEAIKTQVAFLTTQGMTQLSQSSWSDKWLAAWQDAMLRQNTQQLAHCKTALTPDYRPPISIGFEAASDLYLEQFGETGALTVMIIGALPFAAEADTADASLLEESQFVLQHLARLLRLAQDVRPDGTERLNLSVFATASTQTLTLAEARLLLRSDASFGIQRQLLQVYQHQRDETQRALLNLRMRPSITAFCQTCVQLANQIAGDNHPTV